MTSELLFQFDKGFNKTILGTDEAGRGPAAGGVFAAAVCFEKVTGDFGLFHHRNPGKERLL